MPAGPVQPVITAARFIVNIDGVETAFSELTGINSEVEPSEYISAGPGGDIIHTKQYGKTKPPTITLKRGVDTNAQMWTWHQAALMGDPAGRRTATLTLQDAQGKNFQKYVLEWAWVSKLEIGGLKAGDSAVVVETVTIVCDYIDFQPC
jgi:phage tail-like protein